MLIQCPVIFPDALMDVIREYHLPFAVHVAISELTHVHRTVGKNHLSVTVKRPLPEFADVGNAKLGAPGAVAVEGAAPELAHIYAFT